MSAFTLSAAEWDVLRLSVKVALGATLLILPLGVFMGYLLARREFRGRTIVEILITLPLVMPPVATGLILLLLLGRESIVGGWLERAFGIRFVFNTKGAVVAAAVVSFPLLVKAAQLAFSGVDPRLEGAARTLGAGRVRTFFAVSLPLAWPGVAAGLVLAFARCLGEFGATIVFAGNVAGRTRILPLAMYNAYQSPDGMGEATRLLALSVLIASAALVAGTWLDRRGKKKLGRMDAS
ncbi:MAG TPA: molybdate ABC transporter permease subunit [Planctomycetes bacterium]|nr:molybdate ABC transporter permease subunit [Planctomycetota bacterium]